MTEAEWLACDDLALLTRLVPVRGTARLARLERLFLVACCRPLCRGYWDARWQDALDTAERHADGLASLGELVAARGRIEYRHLDSPGRMLEQLTAEEPNWLAASLACHLLRKERGGKAHPGAEQARLFREVFGNPFRVASLLPECRTSAVHSLARAAYENCHLPSGHLDNARLAVLSDALEEAGCTDADILTHLRSPGPHVRGCWALDLVLGKG